MNSARNFVDEIAPELMLEPSRPDGDDTCAMLPPDLRRWLQRSAEAHGAVAGRVLSAQSYAALQEQLDQVIESGMLARAARLHWRVVRELRLLDTGAFEAAIDAEPEWLAALEPLVGRDHVELAFIALDVARQNARARRRLMLAAGQPDEAGPHAATDHPRWEPAFDPTLLQRYRGPWAAAIIGSWRGTAAAIALDHGLRTRLEIEPRIVTALLLEWARGELATQQLLAAAPASGVEVEPHRRLPMPPMVEGEVEVPAWATRDLAAHEEALIRDEPGEADDDAQRPWRRAPA